VFRFVVLCICKERDVSIGQEKANTNTARGVCRQVAGHHRFKQRGSPGSTHLARAKSNFVFVVVLCVSSNDIVADKLTRDKVQVRNSSRRSSLTRRRGERQVGI